MVFFAFLQYYDLAADVLAENSHLTFKFLTQVSLSSNHAFFTLMNRSALMEFLLCLCFQYMYDFLEAAITRQTSKEEAYRKLDEMANKQTEALRKLTKQVQYEFFWSPREKALEK